MMLSDIAGIGRHQGYHANTLYFSRSRKMSEDFRVCHWSERSDP